MNIEGVELGTIVIEISKCRDYNVSFVSVRSYPICLIGNDGTQVAVTQVDLPFDGRLNVLR